LRCHVVLQVVTSACEEPSASIFMVDILRNVCNHLQAYTPSQSAKKHVSDFAENTSQYIKYLHATKYVDCLINTYHFYLQCYLFSVYLRYKII
jgi:hypothetical protein